jgi:hypothetical protein
MRRGYVEPIPSDFDSYEEYEEAHLLWEEAIDDYCEEYLERRRDR